MSLQYLSLKLDKPASSEDLIELVERSLRQTGEPIRWAITKVDTACIELEAVVQGRASH